MFSKKQFKESLKSYFPTFQYSVYFLGSDSHFEADFTSQINRQFLKNLSDHLWLSMEKQQRIHKQSLPTIPESNVNKHLLGVYSIPTSFRKENKTHTSPQRTIHLLYPEYKVKSSWPKIRRNAIQGTMPQMFYMNG